MRGGQGQEGTGKGCTDQEMGRVSLHPVSVNVVSGGRQVLGGGEGVEEDERRMHKVCSSLTHSFAHSLSSITRSLARHVACSIRDKNESLQLHSRTD